MFQTPTNMRTHRVRKHGYVEEIVPGYPNYRKGHKRKTSSAPVTSPGKKATSVSASETPPSKKPKSASTSGSNSKQKQPVPSTSTSNTDELVIGTLTIK